MMKTIAICLALSGAAGAEEPEICKNNDLFRAVQIIDSSCNAQGCSETALKELEKIDKPTLMSALRDPHLEPVHIFFPAGKELLGDAYDWPRREGYLKTLAYADPKAVAYVLGQASPKGKQPRNTELSRHRAEVVAIFLERVLHIPCWRIQKGWFGSTVLQLDRVDANQMNIDAAEYSKTGNRHKNLEILNQGVHVFIYPCPSRFRMLASQKWGTP